MSKKSYATKARKFVVSNPDGDASEAQRKSISWLLKTRETSVDYGNFAVEQLTLPMTRADADFMIKKLAKCPTMRKVVREESIQAAERAMDTVASIKQPDITKLALAGKLGKVAQRKARALVA